MKFRWMIAVMALGLLAGEPGAAADPVVSYSYAYVTKVNVTTDGYLQVNVRGNYRSEHGCTEHSWAKSLYPVTSARTQAMMQVAMASFLSRSKVWVTTQGCVPLTTGASHTPTLVSIMVEQD